MSVFDDDGLSSVVLKYEYLNINNDLKYEQADNSYDISRENLLIKLQDFLFERETNGGGLVYLLSQKPYRSSRLMCADDWHANDAGRAWRTEELYQLINDKLQFKK